jgi:FSR family fosmidomycin resistance protein-like MFS transporter
MPLFSDSLFLSIAAGHLMVDIFNSSRPVLLTYMGLGETRIALISTIYIWVSALTQPLFGYVTDRLGPRWLAAGGVLWMTVFYALTIFLPPESGLICLIIAGLGSAAYHPVGTVQATLQGRHRLEGRETTATSLFFMAGQSGHFIGPILTGLILAKLNMPGLLIFSVVSIPIGFTLIRRLQANHPHPKQVEHTTRITVGIGFVLVLATVAAFQSWAQTNIVNLMPKYLKDFGLSAATYGNLAGLFMGGSALGNFIGGYFADKYSKRHVASIALLLAAFPIFTMSRIGWSWWLYALVPLAGALTGAVHSIMVVIAQRMLPGGMALVSGLVLGFIFSAGALGMLFTGPLAEARGFPAVLLLTTGLVLVASPLALLLKEPMEKRD